MIFVWVNEFFMIFVWETKWYDEKESSFVKFTRKFHNLKGKRQVYYFLSSFFLHSFHWTTEHASWQFLMIGIQLVIAGYLFYFKGNLNVYFVTKCSLIIGRSYTWSINILVKLCLSILNFFIFWLVGSTASHIHSSNWYIETSKMRLWFGRLQKCINLPTYILICSSSASISGQWGYTFHYRINGSKPISEAKASSNFLQLVYFRTLHIQCHWQHSPFIHWGQC